MILMGLFFSLKQQLMIQRAREAGSAERAGNAPVQDVFNSFVAGSAVAAPVPSSGAVFIPDAPTPGQPQQSYEPAAKAAAAPSSRTNIEENSIMKREMQSQMAVQNKMRALKQQELNKYKTVDHPQYLVLEDDKGKIAASADPQVPIPAAKEEEMKGGEASSRMQGAGESAANDGVADDVRQAQRQRALSIGGPDEFWHTDGVDEQLFEFLLNN